MRLLSPTSSHKRPSRRLVAALGRKRSSAGPAIELSRDLRNVAEAISGWEPAPRWKRSSRPTTARTRNQSRSAALGSCPVTPEAATTVARLPFDHCDTLGGDGGRPVCSAVGGPRTASVRTTATVGARAHCLPDSLWSSRRRHPRLPDRGGSRGLDVGQCAPRRRSIWCRTSRSVIGFLRYVFQASMARSAPKTTTG